VNKVQKYCAADMECHMTSPTIKVIHIAEIAGWGTESLTFSVIANVRRYMVSP
jgi:hypothetical protein